MHCPAFFPIHCKLINKYDQLFISYAKIDIDGTIPPHPPKLISSTYEVNHDRKMLCKVCT